MKNLILLIVLSVSLPVFAELPEELTLALGTFQPVLEESDYYCKELNQVRIEALDDDADGIRIVDVGEEGQFRFDDVFNGINTNWYREHSLINAVVRARHVFKDSRLVVQEKSYLLLPHWFFKYEDKRVVLEVISENTLLYNFDSYGTTVCTLSRVNFRH